MAYRWISTLLPVLALTVGAQEPKLQPGKGVAFESADRNATLNIGGRIQARHTYEESSDSSYFHVPRLRLALKGTLYREWKWEFQSDFANRNSTTLKDGFVERAFGEAINLRFGQYKVAFDRQQLESSGRQTFADRNVASTLLGKGRDAGVQAHGAFVNRIIQYQTGLFNGTGEGVTNTNTGHMAVGRVSLNPLGDFGLSQGDIKPSASPRVFLDAAAYHGQDDGGSLDGTTGIAVGAGAKAAGAYAAGEYFHRETSAGQKADGFYLQASYMAVPELLEIAARFARVDPDKAVPDTTRGELTGGVNVFFNKAGHGLKLTGDLSLLTDEAKAGADQNVLRTRVQLQLVF